MNVFTRRNHKDHLVIDVVDVETLDAFEDTVTYIVRTMNGKMMDRLVGPDGTATSFVRFNRIVFLFDLIDMVGMVITVSDKEHEEMAMKIADQLREFPS